MDDVLTRSPAIGTLKRTKQGLSDLCPKVVRTARTDRFGRTSVRTAERVEPVSVVTQRSDVKGRALMPQLSPEGRRVVEDVARRMGFSSDAVTSMLLSIVAGRGGMAQFNHPEFGGSDQWMSGGAIMISDMFNNVLKARVAALCNELSALIRDKHGIPFQSQSQGKPAELNARLSSLLSTETSRRSNWWRSISVPPPASGPRMTFATPIFPPSDVWLSISRGR